MGLGVIKESIVLGNVTIERAIGGLSGKRQINVPQWRFSRDILLEPTPQWKCRQRDVVCRYLITSSLVVCNNKLVDVTE
jgi:hypothetical protein